VYSLGSDKVFIGRITGEGWIEFVSVFRKHVILDGIRQLEFTGRQTEGIVFEACIQLISQNVKAHQSSVNVQPRNTQCVVVTSPEREMRWEQEMLEMIRSSDRQTADAPQE